MTKTLVCMTLALGALASPALAGKTTVTLAVRNWYCAACPHVIKQSLAAVPGVTNVTISDKTKTVSVTFDDAKTDVKSLAQATTAAGYPSLPLYGRDAVAMRDRTAWTVLAASAGALILCAGQPRRPGDRPSGCHYIASDNHAAYRY